jgi:peptide-methionine (S)-S-oxide reductase
MAAIAREQLRVSKFNSKVVTEVRPAAIFWPAEVYHQRKLQKGGQSAAKDATAEVRCYG